MPKRMDTHNYLEMDKLNILFLIHHVLYRSIFSTNVFVDLIFYNVDNVFYE